MTGNSNGKSIKYRIVRAADKAINFITLLLVLIMLLYAGYSVWYNHSLQNGSFLPDELAKYKPNGEKPNSEYLMEKNPDITSWITIDDTRIDYPVVQGQDDREYLNKDVMGEFSLAGSIFLTVQNKKDFSDPYNVVYGHHVEGGAMFADVVEFRKASFFKNHTTGTLWHIKGRSDSADRIEIFAVVEVGADDRKIYCDPSTVRPQELPELVEYIRDKATHERDPKLNEDSRIIALSTCEDATSFERVILFGKLRPMTAEEIKAAKEKDGGAGQDHKGIMGLLMGLPPWVLISTGTLLLILMLYILWRIHKSRRQRKAGISK